MGLDSVELVLAVEEEFGIDISDQEAGCIRTVGELYELVLSKVAGRPQTVCLTATAFHRFRASAQQIAGVPRQSVKPTTALAALLPPRDRRRFWRSLSTASRLALPPLLRPRWLVTLLTLATVLSSISLALALPVSAAVQWSVVFPLALVAFAATSVFATKPLATQPPAPTVAELSLDLVRLNPGLRAFGSAPGSSEAWSLLVRIFQHQLGLPAEKIVPSARIVADLGVD